MQCDSVSLCSLYSSLPYIENVLMSLRGWSVNVGVTHAV